MVMLLGLLVDTPMYLVYEELKKLHTPCIFLNHCDLEEMKVNFSFGSSIKGTIEIYGKKISINEISSSYFRTYNFFDYEGNELLSYSDKRIQKMATTEDILWSWAELTDTLMINPPSAMASNNSKPYQSEIIKLFGFSIPETLVTTSPNEAEKFWKRHGNIIYKSNSGVRSIIRKISENDRKRFLNIQFCPTLFQEFITGTDYRVHVVGNETYSCKINSSADDYRYENNEMEIVILPGDIENKCIALTKHLGLHFSGIDLRKAINGKWYCFEVNPSPAFSYFEMKTGLPIANAVARMLSHC